MMMDDWVEREELARQLKQLLEELDERMDVFGNEPITADHWDRAERRLRALGEHGAVELLQRLRATRH
jgi:hypothetical protein